MTDGEIVAKLSAELELAYQDIDGLAEEKRDLEKENKELKDKILDLESKIEDTIDHLNKSLSILERR